MKKPQKRLKVELEPLEPPECRTAKTVRMLNFQKAFQKPWQGQALHPIQSVTLNLPLSSLLKKSAKIHENEIRIRFRCLFDAVLHNLTFPYVA